MCACLQLRICRTRLACLSGLLMLISGCGGEATYAVKGQVLLEDGSPVGAGQIEFRSTDRPISAIGFVQPDGSFELTLREKSDGTYAGNYRVALVEPAPPPGIPGKEAEEANLAAARELWLAHVPRKYRSVETSGLQFQVTDDASQNVFRIVLQQ
jgi:hypothetical protein